MGEMFTSGRTPPSLNVPNSKCSVTLKLINTTAYIKGPGISALLQPHIQGHDTIGGPSYAFLIERESGGKTRKVLFDLGMRKDSNEFSPLIKGSIEAPHWSIHVDKTVAEILEEGGVSRNDIEAIIWR